MVFVLYILCYLYFGKGVLLICDFGCWEYFKIFWIIKGFFIELDIVWEFIKGMWNIGIKCGLYSQIWKCFIGRSVSLMKVIKLGIEVFLECRRCFIDFFFEVDVRNRFVDGVGLVIVSILNWNSDVMDWIVYLVNGVNFDDLVNLYIIVVLVDKKVLGIVNILILFVNFDQIMLEFVFVIEEG